MAEKAEQEIHLYLDDLCRSGFFGQVIFYFQNGNIEHCRENVDQSKTEIIEKYKDAPKSTHRVLEVRVNGAAPKLVDG